MKRHKVLTTLLGLLLTCCDSSNTEDMWKRYANASLNPGNYHSDAHYLVRSRTLLSDKISSQALQALAKDSSWYVRSKVAQHEKTTPQILALLAKDEQLQVRRAVAQNGNTSPEVLVELAKDPQWQVRFAVADNDNVPVSILHEWCTSPSHFTKKELFYRLAHHYDTFRKLRDLLDNKNETAIAEKMCSEVARYTCAHPEILRDLSKHPNYEVRLQVAQNSSTPADCLQDLAKDEDESVRSEVIYNSSTTKEILEAMIATEEDEDIKEEAQDMLDEKEE
ncbi:HEAT repeat domain-containing protein [Candidatus Uabimicrobium amorphum]|uniref:AbrB family transcriptional regulator n=1 Tax=Uabimicrobium amorphum TaxID=2596890 RepID=A0A5S9F6E6_UABAM|nr:hypothetical protein [Candidatus Uabimicrobium amorphum]BBM87301.1 AbrB family transcriptional regulator [Candidatus Uabimicrobium amorphum]